MKIIVNGEPAELQEQCTVAELLDARGIGRERVAVEVNREIVPRAVHTTHALHDGDQVEIVHFVGGG